MNRAHFHVMRLMKQLSTKQKLMSVRFDHENFYPRSDCGYLLAKVMKLFCFHEIYSMLQFEEVVPTLL